MILSVSRRTDIPSYYSDWFFNRIKEGFVMKIASCAESIDVGTYNTCKNGCKYCYANYSAESIIKNCSKYDPQSPILCGVLGNNDKITERKVTSQKEHQLQFELY